MTTTNEFKRGDRVRALRGGPGVHVAQVFKIAEVYVRPGYVADGGRVVPESTSYYCLPVATLDPHTGQPIRDCPSKQYDGENLVPVESEGTG